MNTEIAREKVREVRQALHQAVVDVTRMSVANSYEQRIHSLRRKSQLTRQLLEAQSELLLAIRNRPADARQNDPVSSGL